MKTKILRKVLICIFILLFLVFCVNQNYLYATDWQNLNQFDGNSNDKLNTSAKNIVGAILNVTRIIGTGVAIIMLIAVAMKYMMSAPGERADIKKHAVPYVVGAVVLFGSVGILSIIQNFTNNIK